jgi:HEAT repeat protein
MSRPWPPFEDLLRGLDAPDRRARCRAARALGEVRDPRAVGPLLRALRDPSGDVRARAAVALGRLRDERALAPLIAAMGDPKASVRSGASAAVRKFGETAYRPLLDAYPEAGDDHRTALLVALSRHGTAEVFALLLDAYSGASGRPRSVLLDALARYKTPAASELLIAALDDPDRKLHRHVVRLLARRKDRRAVEPLLRALAGATARVEHAALAWSLAADEGRDAQESLREEMTEWSDAAIRIGAYVQALGEIGDPRAFGPLQDLLEVDEGIHLIGLVTEVVRALRRIDNPRAVDHLHRLLDDPSYPWRDRLEMTLASMDLMNALHALATRSSGQDFGALWRGLEATLASQGPPHPLEADIEEDDPSIDEAEARRIGTDLMRRLEETIRGLGRDEPGA